MANYIITSESTIDLTTEKIKNLDIPIIPFSFALDGKEYPDDFGKTYPLDKFYNDIKNGATPVTSQINIQHFKEFFEPFLKEGKDVMHVTLSSGVTNTINSCMVAARELSEKYDNKVYVLDSLGASSGIGILVEELKKNLDNGMSIEDNVKWFEDNKLRMQYWFFSSDLSSFIRGGRLTKTAGLIGTALKICPLMRIDSNGKLDVVEKIRTKHKAITKIVEKMEEYCDNGLDYDGPVAIAQSACLQDAEVVKELVLSKFKNVKEVKIYNIGTIIGVHTGPGTIALFYYGKKRTD